MSRPKRGVKRATAAKAFMLNEWQRKRLVASGEVDRSFGYPSLAQNLGRLIAVEVSHPALDGRHHLGMVAGFSSERWPVSNRNPGRRAGYNSHAGRSVTCATPTASAQRTSASTTADSGITDHQHK
jgi:hypothetical protein